MDMPKAGPEHARLQAFVGEWEGPEQLEPSPWGPGGSALGRMSFRADLDGFAVIQEYIELKDSRITFRGHGVFTVDPASKETLWYWFDSMGFPPEGPARGTFEDNRLTLTRETPRGASRYVFEISANECTFAIENKLGGEPEFKRFMYGKYHRRED